MRDDKPNLIVEMSFQFAVDVTIFCDELDKLKKFRLSNQLFGSGTGIGANVREAQSAESKKDFIHKIKIVLKELRETSVCLRILSRASYFPSKDPICKECNELIAIFVKSLTTARRNLSIESGGRKLSKQGNIEQGNAEF